jgi:hypothetical protein
MHTYMQKYTHTYIPGNFDEVKLLADDPLADNIKLNAYSFCGIYAYKNLHNHVYTNTQTHTQHTYMHTYIPGNSDEVELLTDAPLADNVHLLASVLELGLFVCMCRCHVICIYAHDSRVYMHIFRTKGHVKIHASLLELGMHIRV